MVLSTASRLADEQEANEKIIKYKYMDLIEMPSFKVLQNFRGGCSCGPSYEVNAIPLHINFFSPRSSTLTHNADAI